MLSTLKISRVCSSVGARMKSSRPLDPSALQSFGGQKIGLMLEMCNETGSLAKALSVFNAAGINLSFIQSLPPIRQNTSSNKLHIQIEAEADPTSSGFQDCLRLLRSFASYTLLDPPVVPWFPTHITDLNAIGKTLLTSGDGMLNADHPGFTDEHYKTRRDYVVKLARDYNLPSREIPIVRYEESELETWSFCYGQLTELYKRGACESYRATLSEMEKYCKFRKDNIPQLRDISAYLEEKTGWRIKPVGGLLSGREFLNSMAFKVFHSTQYIRHRSRPLYTPEPDVVHELMGHAPMFANQNFADLSQEIGLASLGASDADIAKLAAVYWYTVEFGLCEEGGERKAYGAGVLSSVEEMEWAMKGEAEYKPLDCDEIEKHVDFPITVVQPLYFVASNFEDAKESVQEYSSELKRPFKASFQEEGGYIAVDRRLLLQ